MFFSIALLFSPILNLLLLCVLKDARCTQCGKVFHYIVFAYLLITSVVQKIFFWKALLCNFIALGFVMLIEKIYTVIINTLLRPIVEKITGSNMISSVYFISSKIYVMTDTGYTIIDYITKQYRSYDDYNEIPVVEQKHFNKIKGNTRGRFA